MNKKLRVLNCLHQ